MRIQSALREQVSQEIHGCFRSGIELDFIDARKFFAMRDDNAVNGTIGCDGNVVDDSIGRIAQEFETGDECDVELAAGEALTKRGGMVESDRARPAGNERARVEIFHATDARLRLSILHALSAG